MLDAEKDKAFRASANEAANFFNQGHKTTAKDLACNVLDQFLNDEDMEVKDCKVLDMLCVILENTNGYVHSLAAFRRIAQLNNVAPFENGFYFFRSLEMSEDGAQLSDFQPKLSPDQLGRQIMIACIPKSGSTFLFNTLSIATRFERRKLCLNYSNEENLLYPPFMERSACADTVAQEHLRASPQNIALIQAYSTTTVVLVRNIFDSLISMRDMLLKPETGSTTTFFTNELAAMDEETQLDATIDKWAHWQLEFYASWVRVLSANRVSGYVLTYEQLIENKASSIIDIAKCVDVPLTHEQAEQAIIQTEGDAYLSRINQGISGRGTELMNQRQIDKIKSMVRYYPDIDFTPLGL
ncbi:MAG: hypothetical protein HON65_04005 [Rhodospirillales bacterium]|nr:hypothetical protein [Rhodospirillales bacterium]